MDLTLFNTNFYHGLKALFEYLKIPVSQIDDKPLKPRDILTNTFREGNGAFALMDDVFFLGLVDDRVFAGQESISPEVIRREGKDYDGILIFGVTLRERDEGRRPTRTQLATITRAFNSEFHYTPVVVVFQYGAFDRSYITLAQAERRPYKQESREGERIGKVTLLRDIDVKNPHAGHRQILQRLAISETAHPVGDFASLYAHWQAVFNVSLLNKQFYQELFDWYSGAVKACRFPAAAEAQEKGRNVAVIRLITRIIFIWFMREQKLVSEDLFDQEKIKEILQDTEGESSTYYRAILQNLFFATLSTQPPERKFGSEVRGPKGYNEDYGNQYVFRYQECFRYPEKIKEYFGDIPFLNGGLFECLDQRKNKEGGKEERIVIDGFSRVKKNQPYVPNFLFFSPTAGLFTILSAYNFTIDENTPIEEDIALDPELLGRVFENLLASYNPETNTTARKQTGSFYTPREIVNYMVEESLMAYLKNSLSGHVKNEAALENNLRDLLGYNDIQPFAGEEVGAIIAAIDRCRLLDPACGSGAFPMGALQKMVHIIKKVDPMNERWKERQIGRAGAIEDVVMREKFTADIEGAFANNELDYGRKLYLIENCIYGVDIQGIAVQISKLRFFISLLVEQKVDKAKDNWGIRPLPNLETKFVTANTLIGLDTSEQMLLSRGELEVLKERLHEVRHLVFSAKSPKEKERLRGQDAGLREKIIERLKESMGDVAAEQLASWDPYDQNGSAGFFDAEWMFGVNGFDVVVGNPPYIQLQKFKGQKIQKQLAEAGYKSHASMGDIYCLFYEQGIGLLKAGGRLIYITSNKWMRAGYGASMRKFFVENTNPLKLLDFGGHKIFGEVTVDCNILLVEKASNQRQCQACVFTGEDTGDIQKAFENNKVVLNNLSEQNWIIADAKTLALKEKIERVGVPLKDWDISINYGIKTGYNEAFIINRAKRDELIAKDPKSAEIIKPILRGRDIKRYWGNWAGLYLIGTHNGYFNGENSKIPAIKINDYPAIKEHLDLYYPQLKRRQDKGGTPYNLRNCAYYLEFEKELIVWKAVGENLTFSLWGKSKFLLAPASFINAGRKNKYLLLFLHSKLIKYRILQNADRTGAGDVMLNIQSLENIPIPKPIPEVERQAVELVDRMMALQERYHGAKTEAEREQVSEQIEVLDREIDGLVCGVYGLTEGEIKIVGGNLK